MEALSDQFHRDREDLDAVQREIVAKIRERLKTDDLTNADLCKFADKCADFQKAADNRVKLVLARERLVVSDRRISAAYHIAQARNDANLEIARLRAETASASRRPNHPQKDEDNEDPTAPYGRRKNGDAYTYDEFKSSLDQAVKEIWGLPPINPKSYMVYDMKRAPDGALLPPDEPPIPPGRAPDGFAPDIEDAATRAGGAGPGRLPDDDPSRAPPPSKNPFVNRNSSIELERESPDRQQSPIVPGAG